VKIYPPKKFRPKLSFVESVPEPGVADLLLPGHRDPDRVEHDDVDVARIGPEQGCQIILGA
jgi:hypothetical protein